MSTPSDTVPAMLTPGEVVLNEKQQTALGNMMAGGGKVSAGQAKADALFKHIGVPGYKEGVYLSRDEVRKKGEPQYDRLKKTVDKEGFDPNKTILIEVNHKGEAYIKRKWKEKFGDDSVDAVLEYM